MIYLRLLNCIKHNSPLFLMNYMANLTYFSLKYISIYVDIYSDGNAPLVECIFFFKEL